MVLAVGGRPGEVWRIPTGRDGRCRNSEDTPVSESHHRPTDGWTPLLWSDSTVSGVGRWKGSVTRVLDHVSDTRGSGVSESAFRVETGDPRCTRTPPLYWRDSDAKRTSAGAEGGFRSPGTRGTYACSWGWSRSCLLSVFTRLVPHSTLAEGGAGGSRDTKSHSEEDGFGQRVWNFVSEPGLLRPLG